MKNIPAKLLLLATILLAFLVISSDRQQAAKKVPLRPEKRSGGQQPARQKGEDELPTSRWVLPMDERMMIVA